MWETLLPNNKGSPACPHEPYPPSSSSHSVSQELYRFHHLKIFFTDSTYLYFTQEQPITQRKKGNGKVTMATFSLTKTSKRNLPGTQRHRPPPTETMATTTVTAERPTNTSTYWLAQMQALDSTVPFWSQGHQHHLGQRLVLVSFAPVSAIPTGGTKPGAGLVSVSTEPARAGERDKCSQSREKESQRSVSTVAGRGPYK